MFNIDLITLDTRSSPFSLMSKPYNKCTNVNLSLHLYYCIMGKQKYKLHASAMFNKGQHILLDIEKQIYLWKILSWRYLQ